MTPTPPPNLPTSPKYLFVGGGSGGHITPLIAVAHALKETEPQADILFLCSDKRLDQEFFKDAGLPFDTLPTPRRGALFFLPVIRNYLKTMRIIRERKPDAVFSKGGGVSVPACFAAHRKGIPVVMHESDVVMGNSNRKVSGIATKVCLGFSTENKNSPAFKIQNSKFIVTGNPIRPEMTAGSKDEALRITGLSGTRPILLVVGGSQGAKAINDAVVENIDALLKLCDVIHITGTGKGSDVSRKGYWQAEMSSGNLPHFYAAATLAVGRASASMMTELAANGVPTILVPIRGLAQDHQYKNAIMARDNGGCVLLLQEEMQEKLVSEISRILNDDGLRSQMRKKITHLYQSNAAVRIAKIIGECVAQRKNLP